MATARAIRGSHVATPSAAEAPPRRCNPRLASQGPLGPAVLGVAAGLQIPEAPAPGFSGAASAAQSDGRGRG